MPDGVGLLPDDERHLDGHAARRRRRRDPRPAAPELDRRAAQGAPDEHRVRAGRPATRRTRSGPVASTSRAAIDTAVRSTGSVLLGNFDWPHDPSDGAVTKDITFTNAGDADVTLDLALTQRTDAFTLGASTVTVPAGGTATVPVTGDPTAVEFGRHVGYVIGTDTATGDELTRTSLGLVKEDEHYDLTIKLVDREGSTGRRVGRDHQRGRPLAVVGVRRRRDHASHDSRHLPRLDVPRRAGRGTRPIRPGRAGRPRDGPRPGPRGGPRRA